LLAGLTIQVQLESRTESQQPPYSNEEEGPLESKLIESVSREDTILVGGTWLPWRWSEVGNRSTDGEEGSVCILLQVKIGWLTSILNVTHMLPLLYDCFEPAEEIQRRGYVMDPFCRVSDLSKLSLFTTSWPPLLGVFPSYITWRQLDPTCAGFDRRRNEEEREMCYLLGESSQLLRESWM